MGMFKPPPPQILGKPSGKLSNSSLHVQAIDESKEAATIQNPLQKKMILTASKGSREEKYYPSRL